MKKCILWGNWVSKRSRKGLGETLTIKKIIIIYQFSMFKSLDSIASVVGISKFKQVLWSRKGLDYNTGRSTTRIFHQTFKHGIISQAKKHTKSKPCSLLIQMHCNYFHFIINENNADKHLVLI